MGLFKNAPCHCGLQFFQAVDLLKNITDKDRHCKIENDLSGSAGRHIFFHPVFLLFRHLTLAVAIDLYCPRNEPANVFFSITIKGIRRFLTPHQI